MPFVIAFKLLTKQLIILFDYCKVQTGISYHIILIYKHAFL